METIAHVTLDSKHDICQSFRICHTYEKWIYSNKCQPMIPNLIHLCIGLDFLLMEEILLVTISHFACMQIRTYTCQRNLPAPG